MAKIERFEDIQAWQKARELVRDIYAVTSKGNFARDYSLKDQIRRASVSIMSNIAEGYARQTNKEFSQFLHIALGSVAPACCRQEGQQSGLLTDSVVMTDNLATIFETEIDRVIGNHQ